MSKLRRICLILASGSYTCMGRDFFLRRLETVLRRTMVFSVVAALDGLAEASITVYISWAVPESIPQICAICPEVRTFTSSHLRSSASLWENSSAMPRSMSFFFVALLTTISPHLRERRRAPERRRMGSPCDYEWGLCRPHRTRTE